MYIPSRALSGPRSQRLIVGAILTPLMTGMGVVFSLLAGNSTGDLLTFLALAAAALSAFVLAWWCTRFWYAALRKRPGPNPWPWALSYVTLLVIFTVSGIRNLLGGDQEGGIGMLVMAGLLCLPLIGGLVALLIHVTQSRLRRRRPAPSRQAPARQRTHRAWGPIE